MFLIQVQVDFLLLVVFVDCELSIIEIINREEKSVEAIVDHLKANHSNENPPRFINGQFSKKKQKHSEGVIKPREAMVIPKFIEPLPSIYSQPPSFSIVDYDLPNQDIHIIHHQQSSTIPIFQSISLDKHNYAINTGGCITSSCMFTHDDNLLIALISHKGKIGVPKGDDCINLGDTVVVVTKHTGLDDIQDILR